MGRRAPEVLVALLLMLLLGAYVVYTRRVVRDLRGEALRSSRMYARVFSALSDPREGIETQALLDLAKTIREQRVPLVVTDTMGRPTAFANLPFEPAGPEDPRIVVYLRELNRYNPPVIEPGIGEIHYGATPLVRGLTVIPALMAATAAILVVAAAVIVRTRGNATRERVMAGMARESAHQLGTPLSSLAGWIEVLEDSPSESTTRKAVVQMRSDLDRLDRVAHRFERIGRDPKRETVDLAALAERIAAYFRVRVPTLKNTITIEVRHESGALATTGDPVLLEWALEVLVKNAVDALAGRGGRIELVTGQLSDGSRRVRVRDDGPGVPRELRTRIFDPGFSTKERGWGIGLSLARRIVRENHRGELQLAASERGATFDVILR